MAKQQPQTQQPRSDAANSPSSETSRNPETSSSTPSPGTPSWEARGEPANAARQAANAVGEVSKAAVRSAEAASVPVKRELGRASERPFALAQPMLPIMRRWSEDMDQLLSDFFGGRVAARPF